MIINRGNDITGNVRTERTDNEDVIEIIEIRIFFNNSLDSTKGLLPLRDYFYKCFTFL